MARPTLFNNAQGFPNQRIPVAFNYLEIGGYGDDAAPGVWFPFLADVDGNLFVTLGGPGGGPILVPDDADDVAEVATASRVPVASRLYGLDGTSETDYDRIRTDDDAIETAFSNSKPALRVMGRNRLLSNALGDTWTLEHGNDGVSVAVSAARTVETTFGTFINSNWRALHLQISVSVIGADSLTVEIQGRQLFAPFKFYPLLTSAPITTVGDTILKIGIGFTPVANLTANDLITAVWQVVATPSGADPITYSINAAYSV